MNYMTTAEIRESYLRFFESKGCKRMPSSSLIPDDPSLLLTSAGMVQFKPYFLHVKEFDPNYLGATTAQKCVRTNDIDIIGTTGRHLSFFEMMGNFSFGKYFKQEMCAWALEFSTEVLGLPLEKIYCTVFFDDDETIEIWKALGVPDSHLSRLGEEDNFWRAGPTGPCGPCSELYYDQGPEFGCGRPNCAPGCDCDRFLEYWNCVFTQYDGQEDGSLAPLPTKNIDTGLGLERTAAILQGVQSNYDTDILRGLIAVGEKLSQKRYNGTMVPGALDATQAKIDLSLRICADHSRSVSFMIADGILPSNEGRGYVLRRLLRRAIVHGQTLGIDGPFLGVYLAKIIEVMGDVYPELIDNRELIESVIRSEEERFGRTLRTGQNYLDEALERLGAGAGADASANASGRADAGASASGRADAGASAGASGRADASADASERADAGASAGKVLPGEVAFKLHDTYGFPVEVTEEICAERGIIVDREGFEACMEEQRARARAATKDDAEAAWSTYGSVEADILKESGVTTFVGYDQLEVKARIVALVQDGKRVASLAAGSEGEVVLSATPFYAEMGGEVGDTGTITTSDSSAEVYDTRAPEKGLTCHYVRVTQGRLIEGEEVLATVDAARRVRIARNHTGTHILHAALRAILGEHVNQAGSYVGSDRLRFDFTHFQALTREQIAQVEELANHEIMEARPLHIYESSLAEARAAGVTALFGEKYGDEVRVVEAGDFSRELCGGCHVANTAEIGFLKITSESSVGANIRRIEAVTSYGALAYVNSLVNELRETADELRVPLMDVSERVAANIKLLKDVQQTAKRAKDHISDESFGDLLKQEVQTPAGYPVIVAKASGKAPAIPAGGQRQLWDVVRTRMSAPGALVIAAENEGKVTLMAAGTPQAVEAGFDAGALIKALAPAIGGGGGGKAAMAQAGGNNPAGIDEALAIARDMLGLAKK